MKIETILTLGVIGVILYLVLELFRNPQAQALAKAASTGLENAATGGLSGSQVTEIQDSEASQLVAASGGTLTQEEAQSQAAADVNATQNTSTLTYWDGVKAAFSEVF